MLVLLFLLLCPSLVYSIPFDTMPKVPQSVGKRGSAITVNAHYFTGAQCKDYFGTDLVKLGYRPLVVEITNNTEEIYFLEPDSIKELVLVGPKKVYEVLRFSLWSYVSLMAFSVYARAPALVPITIMLPAYVFHRYNQRLWENIQRTVLDPRKPLRIDPGRTVSKVLFCREGSSMFTVEFINDDMTRVASIPVDLLEAVRATSVNPILPALMVS